MKTNYFKSFFTVLICLLISINALAQENPLLNRKHSEREKRTIPKILPTEVQNKYDVKWYFLNLHAENNTVALSGDVTIKAEVAASVLDTFSFHLHSVYTIDSLKINGIKKIWENNEHERIVTGLSLNSGEIFDAQIFYHGAMSGSGGFFSGIGSDVEPQYGFPVTWTLSEPNNAFEWFPVKQSLTDKADSVWVFVTTSETNKVGSNGTLTATVPLPDQKVRYEWKSTYPIDYYLISIAVANYQEYNIYAIIPQTQESVLIQNYLYNTPACLNSNKSRIDKIKTMVELYSELFGPYPFSKEKYGKCLAPIGGGMEHQTMTTQSSFDEWLSAHELTHQWFGDNVTCASWEHIWLNEGFATYGEALWDESQYGQDWAFNEFYNGNIQYVIKNGKSGSVYVPKESVDDENRIFSSVLTYAKGGCLVHMLRFELNNDDLFFQILQTYQQRFTDKTAVTEDLQGVIEELSGKDFAQYFNQWFYGEGYPDFDIHWIQSGEKLNFSSNQTTTASVTPLFKMNFELEITYKDNSSEIVKFYQDQNNQNFSYDIPSGKEVKSIAFDPNRWLLASSKISHTTKIDEKNALKQFSMYPNPANDILHLSFDESLYHEKELKIMDITGKVLFSEKISGEKSYDINVSDFASGIYSVQIFCNGQYFTQKFIRN